MPDRPQTVIINAPPIIALSLTNHLNLLQMLYGTLLMPPAVQVEVLAGGPKNIGVTELQAASWITLTPLNDPRRADLLSDLDRGEAEVLALAQERNAGLVIIDERLARRHAKRLGLTLTGTVGILLRAKHDQLIPTIKPLLQTLVQSGIRLGDNVIAEALKLAKEA